MIGKDFREFIALLNKNEVKYLVVGGYALAFHGHPRYMKDLVSGYGQNVRMMKTWNNPLQYDEANNE